MPKENANLAGKNPSNNKKLNFWHNVSNK